MLTYTPPPGYYDQPFTWIFDGSNLVDGGNALNLSKFIQAGWGDFRLRRMAGWGTVANPSGGKFQVRDRDLNPTESDAVFISSGSDEIPVAPELAFRELDAFRFDLYDVLRAKNSSGGQDIFTSQVCFQGSRRLPGDLPFSTQYSFKSKSFVYEMPFTLTQPGIVAGARTPPVTFRQQIDDYDFELLNIQIVYSTSGAAGTPASATDQDETGSGTTWTFKVPGTAGNAYVLIVNAPGFGQYPAGTPNRALTFTVVPGVSITANLATNAGGIATTTWSQLETGANADAGVSALVTVTAFGPTVDISVASPDPPGGIPFAGGTAGGGWSPGSAQSLTSILLYDYSKNTVQSELALDVFFNELSSYKDGAVVPSLLYKKDGQIQIDIQNNTFNEVNGQVLFIGQQRYPC